MTDVVLDGPTFTVVGEGDLIPILWDVDHLGVHPHRDVQMRTYWRWLHLSPGRVGCVPSQPGLNVLWDVKYRPKITLLIRLRHVPRWLASWIMSTRPKWICFDPLEWVFYIHLRIWRTVR